jgi:BirA family biotin operon repressor/biotin-[acetyl-CoA-carboxylase] ligase
MSQQVIGQNLISLVSVSSTNDYLRNLMDEEELPNGTVVIAAVQHRGKGYGQNVWVSEKGQNLTFSLLLYPTFLTSDNHFLVSKAISLGITDYLEAYLDDVTIKWPNDIFVGNKKICGILIENDLIGRQMKASLIGIGLNVNQRVFPRRLPNPVSLSLVTENKYSLKEELKSLLSCLDNRYQMLMRNMGIGKIHSDYHEKLFRINQRTEFKKDGQKFVCRIIGVNDYGQLILEDQHGKTREFNFKEVEFVL